MKYKYAVSRDMFLCYDKHNEVVAYLHELPLNITSLRIYLNKAVIQATYAWPVLPKGSQLVFCSSEDIIHPTVVEKHVQTMVYTFEVFLQKKQKTIRAYWEYENMQIPLNIQKSDKMKKDLMAGLSVKNRKLTIWKKDILRSFMQRVRRLLNK